MDFTHAAYSDDSGSASQRYQSLALCTLPTEHRDDFILEINELLSESGVEEFKWSKLRSAKYRFAAEKMIECLFRNLGRVRIDIIIWDYQDARHEVLGRDDQENRVRMYFHLVSSTLSRRWPVAGSTWSWTPDNQSGVNWETLWDCLRLKKHECVKDLFNENPDFQQVCILKPTPGESHDHVLIQICDLFAGISVFSRECSDRYFTWVSQEEAKRQPGLFSVSEQTTDFNRTEIERFKTLEFLKDLCGENKLGVGLETTDGLQTRDPRKPLNFWFYQSQHAQDRAPRRPSLK